MLPSNCQRKQNGMNGTNLISAISNPHVLVNSARFPLFNFKKVTYRIIFRHNLNVIYIRADWRILTTFVRIRSFLCHVLDEKIGLCEKFSLRTLPTTRILTLMKTACFFPCLLWRPLCLLSVISLIRDVQWLWCKLHFIWNFIKCKWISKCTNVNWVTLENSSTAQRLTDPTSFCSMHDDLLKVGKSLSRSGRSEKESMLSLWVTRGHENWNWGSVRCWRKSMGSFTFSLIIAFFCVNEE